jgi:uncharacterized repeat protein (TIGR01451 family)
MEWSQGSDATSGLKGYSWAFSNLATVTVDDTVESGPGSTGATATLADGTWYFHLRTLDNAGNGVNQRYGPFVIDTSAPAVTKTVDDSTVAAGDRVAYTVTVGNDSGTTMSNVAVVDQPADGLILTGRRAGRPACSTGRS